MTHIDANKPKTIFLNIVLLFFVALEPYLLNTLNADFALFSFTSTAIPDVETSKHAIPSIPMVRNTDSLDNNLCQEARNSGLRKNTPNLSKAI
jgi:hypothetical protein